MNYRNLGRSGLKVSRLCLGTMNFGWHTSEQDSFALMDKALEMGINFFDTANVYGWKLGEGVTEQIIGRWLAQGNGRRNKIVLATKVFNKMGEGPNDLNLCAYHIRKACDDSLRRFQTDHIDLYQMRRIDRSTPWEEYCGRRWNSWCAKGRFCAGSSNFAGWHIARAQCEARKRCFMGLVSEQSLYNLAARTIELEVIPACREYGLGLMPWQNVMEGGLLSGALEKAKEGRRSEKSEQES